MCSTSMACLAVLTRSGRTDTATRPNAFRLSGLNFAGTLLVHLPAPDIPNVSISGPALTDAGSANVIPFGYESFVFSEVGS